MKESSVSATKKIVWLFGAISVFLVLLKKISLVSSLVLKLQIFTDRSNMDTAMTIYSKGGYSRYSLAIIVAYFLAFMLITRIIKIKYDGLLSSDVIKIMYCLFLTGILAVPFLFVSSSFSRVIRNAYWAVPIMFSIYAAETDFHKLDVLICALLPLSMLLLMYGDGYFTQQAGFFGDYIPYILHFK
jgi:hypothetical protein